MSLFRQVFFVVKSAMKENSGKTGFYERDTGLIYAAKAMSQMYGDGREKPPEYFFQGFDREEALRLRSLFTLNQEAIRLSLIHRDVGDLLKGREILDFTDEDIRRLFNDDFKLGTSKMLHDLCEFYSDQNGNTCLRYKEKFYRLAEKGENYDDEGFALDNFGNRIEINEIQENFTKGRYGIDSEVLKKISRPSVYKDELSVFLALDNGREEPSYMDRMNACAICDFVYVMGDSSFWDRKSLLAPYKGLINCPIRSLNPRNRALKQWGIEDASTMTYDSCYLGGEINDYIKGINYTEEVLGVFVDGVQDIRTKIKNGSLDLLDHKMIYSFYDLAQCKDGSLAQLLMKYAYDSEGNFLPKCQRKFSFDFNRDGDIAMMDSFKKMLDMAVSVDQCFNGLINGDKIKWIRDLKNNLRDIKRYRSIDGSAMFSYQADPIFWRDLLVSLFGADKDRMSSDHICLRQGANTFRCNLNEEDRDRYITVNYSIFLSNLIKGIGLDVFFDGRGVYKLLRSLGVDISDSEDINSFRVAVRNESLDRKERNKTFRLKEEIFRRSK